jgi:hypothetical protein
MSYLTSISTSPGRRPAALAHMFDPPRLIDMSAHLAGLVSAGHVEEEHAAVVLAMAARDEPPPAGEAPAKSAPVLRGGPAPRPSGPGRPPADGRAPVQGHRPRREPATASTPPRPSGRLPVHGAGWLRGGPGPTPGCALGTAWAP